MCDPVVGSGHHHANTAGAGAEGEGEREAGAHSTSSSGSSVVTYRNGSYAAAAAMGKRGGGPGAGVGVGGGAACATPVPSEGELSEPPSHSSTATTIVNGKCSLRVEGIWSAVFGWIHSLVFRDAPIVVWIWRLFGLGRLSFFFALRKIHSASKL